MQLHVPGAVAGRGHGRDSGNVGENIFLHRGVDPRPDRCSDCNPDHGPVRIPNCQPDRSPNKHADQLGADCLADHLADLLDAYDVAKLITNHVANGVANHIPSDV